jgi:SAM-dependent methyltransferase
MGTVSKLDEQNFKKIRENVSGFIARCGRQYDSAGIRVLDIAPQDHEGAKPYFPQATVETLDIDPDSGATYIADLCTNNEATIPSNAFDYVICTEVLEHTLQPFDAVNEIKRILKSGGLAFVSAPFNFRIHGPLPDCWRFTEHGLRALFKDFEIVELTGLEDEERFLMPTHYTMVVRKK